MGFLIQLLLGYKEHSKTCEFYKSEIIVTFFISLIKRNIMWNTMNMGMVLSKCMDCNFGRKNILGIRNYMSIICIYFSDNKIPPFLY